MERQGRTKGAPASWHGLGYGRDGKKGLPLIVYGTLADGEGRPISVQVYPGDTADPTTVPDQVQKLREDFGLQRVVLVGDRGMLTQTQIEVLRRYPALGWLTALRAPAIRELLAKGFLQRSLFDVQNLAEISSPDFPDERPCHEERFVTRVQRIGCGQDFVVGKADPHPQPRTADKCSYEIGVQRFRTALTRFKINSKKLPRISLYGCILSQSGTDFL